MRGYKEINYRAMKLLPRGGYLATASCSPTSPPRSCSSRCSTPPQRTPTVSFARSKCANRPPDHPILWGVPETNYLKFFLFQVI